MTPNTRRILGVAAVVTGIMIGFVVFATPICAQCGPIDNVEAVLYPQAWVTPSVAWLPWGIVLATVLFWGGIALVVGGFQTRTREMVSRYRLQLLTAGILLLIVGVFPVALTLLGVEGLSASFLRFFFVGLGAVLIVVPSAMRRGRLTSST